MKKRSKAYRAKPVAKNPLLKLVRAGVRRDLVAEAEAEHFELAAFTALDRMTQGCAAEAEWDSIAKALNHAHTLSAHGIGPEAAPVLAEAASAMRRVYARYAQGKGLGFDAAGLKAVREALGVWGQMLRLCTIGEIDDASRAVESHYWSVRAAA